MRDHGALDIGLYSFIIIWYRGIGYIGMKMDGHEMDTLRNLLFSSHLSSLLKVTF